MIQENKTNHPEKSHYLYISIIGVVFLAFAVIFLCFPRTQYSELEKRDMAEFPDVSSYNISDLRQLTSDISQWFSDSEPFRDRFMTASMGIRNALGYNFGSDEEAISFKAPGESELALAGETDSKEALEATGNPLADANAKMGNAGIIVVGKGDKVRGLMAYGGTPAMGNQFVGVVRQYVNALPGVHIYALVAPIATEFYIPDKAKSLSKPQKPVIDHIGANMPSGAKLVDSYSYLAAHTDEDIYLRTDHHWAPLGAFYAAKAFAKTAGVPFKELDSYDRHVIHNFVGSMYGYSKDISIKNAPEEFVYYTPKGLSYETTFTTYNTNKNRQISSVRGPYVSTFFKHYGDGSGNAYLTFMGGDQHLVKVKTGTPSNRKLLIIKDSYGNALPGYLFYSFGEVHVGDFRYFLPNLTEYVRENGITDVLLAFNTFNAVSSGQVSRIGALLTKGSGLAPASTPSSKPESSPEKPKEPHESKQVETGDVSKSGSPEPREEQPVEKPNEPEEQLSE